MTVCRFPLFSLFSAVLTAAFLAVSAPTSAAEPSAVRIWPVDPHLKIFGDSPAADAAPLVLRAARNEYESGQFGLRADADVAGLSLAVSDLTNADGAKIAASNVRLRPIGTIPVTKNTPGADAIVVRKAPFDAPDVLREETTLDLTAQTSKGVWVTLFVPSETAPGRYSGTITVASETTRAELPLEVEVFRFELPQERHLWATNWFAYGRFATAAGVEFASEEYWAVLERYFRNMAEHRQNVVYVYWRPGDGLTRATRSKDGVWSVDFSRLERYLKLAEETGVGERFELVHVGGINRDDNTINWADGAVYDEAQGKSVWLPSEEWLEPVLSRLEAYLVETGRIDRCMITSPTSRSAPTCPLGAPRRVGFAKSPRNCAESTRSSRPILSAILKFGFRNSRTSTVGANFTKKSAPTPRKMAPTSNFGTIFAAILTANATRTALWTCPAPASARSIG